MSLKSISSFLATILLIGFTISTGIIVYYFVSTLPKTQTQQVSSLSSQVISCSGGFFDVKNLNGIYKKPVTIYPFNFINSIDSIILTINTTANQLSANHSFYLAKVSPIPSYASLTIYYKNLTSSVTNSLFDIFVNGNKLGTLTVPSGISSYTFINVSVNWLISNGLNNITYKNASINLDSLQIINATLTYNATLSNDLNDYQILITIDTASLISQGKLKNDCSDIRFLDSDDKTLLNYWIESDCNTANTKIWVKVPLIPALTTKTIYFYYGNPSANSLSSIDNTFISNSIFAMSGSCIDSTYCGYMDNHNEANVIRTYSPNICTKYVDRVDWGSVCDSSVFNSGVRNYFYSRFRFLFLADVSGTYTFGIDSDDASEAMYSPTDRYGTYGKESSSGYSGEIVIVGWYGAHAVANSLTAHTGTFNLNAGQGIWIDVLHTEWSGYEGIRLGIQKPGGSMLIVNTANFPNQIFARKYTSPEPTTSVGNEENITINLISSGNPSASMGNQFTSIIYLTNGTIIQKDFSLENNCNLGKDCILGKSTIGLNSNVPIDKIKICSKACSLICNEIKVS